MAFRIRTVFVLASLAFMVQTAPAHADLIDLGNGMIFDTVQDLTWLQDTGYARVTGHSTDGRLSLSDAEAWAADLTFGGFDDWRLPAFFRGTGQRMDQTSELSRMLVSLGWLGDEVGPLEYEESGGVGPFLNFTLNQYWFGDSEGLVWNRFTAWDIPDGGVSSRQGAWAVRDGGRPVGVPEPSTLALLGTGAIVVLRHHFRGRSKAHQPS
jgi:hypothetical protein